MKIKNAAIFLLAFSLKAIGNQENFQITYTEEEKKLVDKILEEYQPTVKKCGPRIQEGTEGYTESLPNSVVFDAGLSCLLAGYKNVFIYDDIKFSKLMKQILYKNNICCFYNDKTSGNNYIFYNPKGKLDAQLLLKSFLNFEEPEDKKVNQNIGIVTGDYLTGHLLGYNDSDILAFYTHIAKKFNKKGDPKENFKNDKEASLDWIKKNEANINDWIKKNSLKYGIKNLCFED